MNLITLKGFEPDELEAMIETSLEVKQNPSRYAHVLSNKTLYMLFQKTSTRTALAFGLGAAELGGRYFTQKWDDSNFTVGDLFDETRYVARNVDIILARLKRHADIENMGKASPVPVINGCCEKDHPTQALADCLTIKEMFGTYRKTMLYVGVWNNIFNSLIDIFPRLGGHLIGVCPIINQASISNDEIPDVIKTVNHFEFYGRSEIDPEKLHQLAGEVDIIYTDTWVDMEYFNNPDFRRLQEERVTLMKPFSVTSDLLQNSRAVVMHDMPIHAGYEIERSVVEGHMETILRQAENRRHVAKGIMMHLLGLEK